MTEEEDIAPVTLAYLRPAPEKEMAAELVVKDGDYYCAIVLSDRALLNMAQTATKLISERGFFKLKENENGLD